MNQKSRDGAESDQQNEDMNPFWLREAFPDAQGIFDARHATLQEIKDDCFVVLDANVLLLPFKLDGVDLKAVADVYRPLATAKRLVIPAQAAREFAKHRSSKVAELVKYLRDEASLSGPKLGKKIGALAQHDEFIVVKTQVDELTKRVRDVQQAINAVADSIAINVGGDPVSNAYREILGETVQPDPDDCKDSQTFKEELKARYEAKRPPGFKDKNKPDSGAGDLLIWKTILTEGVKRKTNCIFVTADEKADWYTQSGGPFQPRFELLEEYRSTSQRTLHIVPLSKLLHIFEVSSVIVDQVKDAEKVNEDRKYSLSDLNEFLKNAEPTHTTRLNLKRRVALLNAQKHRIDHQLEDISKDTPEQSLRELVNRKNEILSELRTLNQQVALTAPTLL